MKNLFGNTKRVATFAMSYIVIGKRKPATNFATGVFYVLTILIIHITAVTPVWSINVPTAYDRCKTTGKDSRFSVYNAKNVLQMADLFNVKTMSSLQIAELTGKAHSNVMRDIRNILEQLEDKHQFNFELMFRTNKLGNGAERKDPYYQLTKKDCLLLASGYDANLRAKIINRWEELESERRNGGFQVPQSFAEALQLAANQQEGELLSSPFYFLSKQP